MVRLGYWNGYQQPCSDWRTANHTDWRRSTWANTWTGPRSWLLAGRSPRDRTRSPTTRHQRCYFRHTCDPHAVRITPNPPNPGPADAGTAGTWPQGHHWPPFTTAPSSPSAKGKKICVIVSTGSNRVGWSQRGDVTDGSVCTSTRSDR